MQRPCAAEWGHIDEYFDPRDKQRHAFSDHSIQIDGGTIIAIGGGNTQNIV